MADRIERERPSVAAGEGGVGLDAKLCPRCGGDHPGLVFKRLQRAAREQTHWALCPTTGEPVMLRAVLAETT